tara:strand:- start:8128 stop:8424 length:297 start_codon:yes stop_codon:yes gene_type:complete
MPWNRVTFTIDQIEEEGALNDMEDRFEAVFMEAEGPPDMAIFSDNDYTDGTISFYFTPGCELDCENIILFYDAEECEPPDIDDVFLFSGNDDALDLLA